MRKLRSSRFEKAAGEKPGPILRFLRRRALRLSSGRTIGPGARFKNVQQPQSSSRGRTRAVLPDLRRHRQRQGQRASLRVRPPRRSAPKPVGVLRRLRRAPAAGAPLVAGASLSDFSATSEGEKHSDEHGRKRPDQKRQDPNPRPSATSVRQSSVDGPSRDLASIVHSFPSRTP